MLRWLVSERTYDLPRNIAFLDTNVLIALADPSDGLHEQTVLTLDIGEYRWIVPHASLLEAWNFLVGRQKRKDLAYQLMSWALTPGRAILMGDAIEPVSLAHEYSKRFGIDLVDASLLDLANRVSRDCSIEPAVHVATYDTADFLRLFGRSGLNFNLYDMKDMSSTTGL